MCLLALAALLGGRGPASQARRLSRIAYRNAKKGIQIYLPKGWHRQVTAAYPGLLVSFRHDAGARLLLSTRTRRPADTPRSAATDTARALRARGMRTLPFTAIRVGVLPGVLLEALPPGGQRRLRQIFVVAGKRLYVLSFWIPEARRTAYAPDLRYILRTARFAR